MTTSSYVGERLRAFVTEREWAAFHTPKNLAAGLAIEAAELQEIFLWTTPDESASPDGSRLAALKEEIGDVQLYLINLADKFSLDRLDCALEKLAVNAIKYPVDKVRGSAKKYTELG